MDRSPPEKSTNAFHVRNRRPAGSSPGRPFPLGGRVTPEASHGPSGQTAAGCFPAREVAGAGAADFHGALSSTTTAVVTTVPATTATR